MVSQLGMWVVAAAGPRRDEGPGRQRLTSFADRRAECDPRFGLNKQLLEHLRYRESIEKQLLFNRPVKAKGVVRMDGRAPGRH
jgi:hypothetical protein